MEDSGCGGEGPACCLLVEHDICLVSYNKRYRSALRWKFPGSMNWQHANLLTMKPAGLARCSPMGWNFVLKTLLPGQIILTGSIPPLIRVNKESQVKVITTPFGDVEANLNL